MSAFDAAAYARERRAVVDVCFVCGNEPDWCQCPDPSDEGNSGDTTPNSGDRNQRNSRSQVRRFALRSAAQVVSRDQPWSHGLPRAVVVPLYGEEGVGKGLYIAHRTATITNAGGTVLYLTGEEAWDTQIQPRLIAAGADLDRVAFLVADDGKDTVARFNLWGTDLAELQTHMVRLPDLTWTVLDPLASFLPSTVNMGTQSEARTVLDPIGDLAGATSSCITPVIHLGRGKGSVRERAQISAAIRQAARHTFAAVKDPDQDGYFYVGVDKSNIAAIGHADRWHVTTAQVPGLSKPTPLASRIGGAAGPIREYALAEQLADGTRTDRRRALVEYLRLEVPEGAERPTSEVKAKVVALGFGEDTYRRALHDAGMESYHPSGGEGAGDRWLIRHRKPRRHPTSLREETP